MTDKHELPKSKIDTALQIIKDNYTMINGCCTNEELKSFNGDFAGYLHKQLYQRKKTIERQKFER